MDDGEPIASKILFICSGGEGRLFTDRNHSRDLFMAFLQWFDFFLPAWPYIKPDRRSLLDLQES